MSAKVTPWIEGDQKPVRVGVYERDYGKLKTGESVEGVVFSHWDGRGWGLFGRTKSEAIRWAKDYSFNKNVPWRGLASDPSKKPKRK